MQKELLGQSVLCHNRSFGDVLQSGHLSNNVKHVKHVKQDCSKRCSPVRSLSADLISALRVNAT